LGLSKKETKELAIAIFELDKEKHPKRLIARAFGVSRSGLYYKETLPEKDKEVVNKINAIYELDDTLGCRKLADLLGSNKNTIFRIMLKYGIKPRRKRPKYYYHGKTEDPATNLLMQKDIAAHLILFSDIFQFRLEDGTWIYCCFVMRKETRQILSFSYGYGIKANLVATAIKRIDLVNDLSDTEMVFHSDQGRQYGAKVTIDSCLEYKFQRSMSRPGTPTDNPFAERFVETFKLAVVERYKYRNLEQFVEFSGKWLNFYNSTRPHSSLGMKAPNKYAVEKGLSDVSYLYLNFV
jgi:transposase InsO family protein